MKADIHCDKLQTGGLGYSSGVDGALVWHAGGPGFHPSWHTAKAQISSHEKTDMTSAVTVPARTDQPGLTVHHLSVCGHQWTHGEGAGRDSVFFQGKNTAWREVMQQGHGYLSICRSQARRRTKSGPLGPGAVLRGTHAQEKESKGESHPGSQTRLVKIQKPRKATVLNGLGFLIGNYKELNVGRRGKTRVGIIIVKAY